MSYYSYPLTFTSDSETSLFLLHAVFMQKQNAPDVRIASLGGFAEAQGAVNIRM